MPRTKCHRDRGASEGRPQKSVGGCVTERAAVVHSDLRAEGLSRRNGETRRGTRRGEEATCKVGALGMASRDLDAAYRPKGGRPTDSSKRRCETGSVTR
jgi:hypothetical protein